MCRIRMKNACSKYSMYELFKRLSIVSLMHCFEQADPVCNLLAMLPTECERTPEMTCCSLLDARKCNSD
jgi:hypothetical protein